MPSAYQRPNKVSAGNLREAQNASLFAQEACQGTGVDAYRRLLNKHRTGNLKSF